MAWHLKESLVGARVASREKDFFFFFKWVQQLKKCRHCMPPTSLQVVAQTAGLGTRKRLWTGRAGEGKESLHRERNKLPSTMVLIWIVFPPLCARSVMLGDPITTPQHFHLLWSSDLHLPGEELSLPGYQSVHWPPSPEQSIGPCGTLVD